MDPPSSPNIDDLLKHYLTLVDTYTTLRAELSRLQTATFQHLARANFAAERGLRFGPDHYDARAQALRTAHITAEEASGAPVFHVVAKQHETETEAPTSGEEAAADKKPPPPRDPLRWFGLLTPPALRLTQASAVDAVERVVPALATVEAEMRRVEIEVRRARKRRAKAAKVEGTPGVVGRADEVVAL